MIGRPSSPSRVRCAARSPPRQGDRGQVAGALDRCGRPAVGLAWGPGRRVGRGIHRILNLLPAANSQWTILAAGEPAPSRPSPGRT